MSTNNRYVIASCGVILHLMLGSTYAWSVYRNPIIAETSWIQSLIVFAIAVLSIFLLYVGYGVLGGIGLGTGYVTAVLMIIKLFPDKRGLATGLAIMGFGFDSVLTGPIAHFLITKYDVINPLYLL